MSIYRSEVASVHEGMLSYGSWVVEDTTEEIAAFYERVHSWCGRQQILLGEGRVEVYPFDHEHFNFKYWLIAPVIEGPNDLIENLSVTI